MPQASEGFMIVAKRPPLDLLHFLALFLRFVRAPRVRPSHLEP